MIVFRSLASQRLREILRNGGVGVLPTDTIYGIVGSALSKKAVERIYRLRSRSTKKPLIVLIGKYEHLAMLGVPVESTLRERLKRFWPGPVSVIVPCPSSAYRYLHRGTQTLAVRLPKNRALVSLLLAVGPLVAPSANIEGFPPASTLKIAQTYFGTSIDFYVDAGTKRGALSSIITFTDDGTVTVIRRGRRKRF